MAKNKHRPPPPRQQSAPPQPSTVPFSRTEATSGVAAGEVLSPERAQDLKLLVEAAHDAASEAGVTEADLMPPAPASSVEQALRDAAEARRYFDAARKKAEDNQSKALQAEKSALQQKQEAEQKKKELDVRREHLNAQENSLIERERSVRERELNAEQDFLVEHRKIHQSLEEQSSRVRAETEALSVASESRRSREEEAWRRRVDARAEEWKREEEQRSLQWSSAVREHGKALSVERERVTQDLSEERRRVLSELEGQRAEQRIRFATDQKALEQMRSDLARRELDLRRAGEQHATEREILEEDRKALQTKVERFAAARVADLESELRAERERLAAARSERDSHWRALESRRELDRIFEGQSPEELLQRLKLQDSRISELKQKLNDSLGQEAGWRLAELEREQSAWREQRAELQGQLAETKARADKLRIGAVELQGAREISETIHTQNLLLSQELKNLKAEVDRYTKADDKRNPMEALLALDVSDQLRETVHTDERLATGLSLPDFVKEIRQRIVGALENRRLFYTPRDIRCFLGGLHMSRLLLLQGISGTGKTSLPLAFASAIGTPTNVVAVQAGWRDRQDLIGYYNAFHRHFYATNFLQELYRAGTPAYRDRPYVIVLDEINLSRVEQFFADLLSALEQPEDKRRLTLLDDPIPGAPALMVEGRHLPVPRNVWFVGTANHDETTTEFADKTYDRAHVMELSGRAPTERVAPGTLPAPSGPLSCAALLEAFDKAGERRQDEVKRASAWLAREDGLAPLLDRRFRVNWGNRFERDIERFVPVVVEAGGTIGEAMDHLLATKVFRKLRDRHDVQAGGLEDVKTKLEALWRDMDGSPERSMKLLDREIAAKQGEGGA